MSDQYATIEFVENKGWITNASLQAYSTRSDIDLAIQGLASKDYVDQSIANIPQVDLTGLASKDYVDQSIANIPQLDLSNLVDMGQQHINPQWLEINKLDNLTLATGATVNAISTDSRLENSNDQTLVTQRALVTYIDRRLGIDRNSGYVPAKDLVGTGFFPLNGQLPLKGNLNLAGHNLVNAATVNKVTITAPIASATLTILNGVTLTANKTGTVSLITPWVKAVTAAGATTIDCKDTEVFAVTVTSAATLTFENLAAQGKETRLRLYITGGDQGITWPWSWNPSLGNKNLVEISTIDQGVTWFGQVVA